MVAVAEGIGARVAREIEPSLEAMGFMLVRVQLSGTGTRTLQIMAEPLDGRTMTVDDCAEISTNVSALLDVSDPISGRYQLEVSSPGIDRPLTRPVDFARFAGFVARIELGTPLDGRKRLKGRLIGADDATAPARVTVDVDGARLELEIGHIARAKLVMTDDLVDAATKGLLPAPGDAPPAGTAEAQNEAEGGIDTHARN